MIIEMKALEKKIKHGKCVFFHLEKDLPDVGGCSWSNTKLIGILKDRRLGW